MVPNTWKKETADMLKGSGYKWGPDMPHAVKDSGLVEGIWWEKTDHIPFWSFWLGHVKVNEHSEQDMTPGLSSIFIPVRAKSGHTL